MWEQDGARVVVDSFTADYLGDAVLDYQDGFFGGFTLVSSQNRLSSC